MPFYVRDHVIDIFDERPEPAGSSDVEASVKAAAPLSGHDLDYDGDVHRRRLNRNWDAFREKLEVIVWS